jgi:hypothetical protein
MLHYYRTRYFFQNGIIYRHIITLLSRIDDEIDIAVQGPGPWISVRRYIHQINTHTHRRALTLNPTFLVSFLPYKY